MKTILVVFTKDENRTVKMANAAKDKKYCYVTEDDIIVGDVLGSPNYASYLLVTDVIEHAYKYYNSGNGSLTDEVNSANCYPIKEIKLNKYEDCIMAYKIND